MEVSAFLLIIPVYIDNVDLIMFTNCQNLFIYFYIWIANKSDTFLSKDVC